MYPSPGSVHCGSCVFLGGPGVSDRVSPGPVSFPIARAVTVSVRLCLARFLLFLLCAFIHVLFAPACLVRPPKPCRAIRVSGACRACRLARQPEIGHPFIPTPAPAPSSAPRPARFWRDAAVLARCRSFGEMPRLRRNARPFAESGGGQPMRRRGGVLPASHFQGREKHFGPYLLPASLILGR